MSDYPESSVAIAVAAEDLPDDKPVAAYRDGEVPDTQPDRPQRTRPIWLVVGIVALAAVAAIVGLVLTPGASPSQSTGTTVVPGLTVPSSPAQVRITAGADGIVVTWVPQGTDSVGFRIYRAQDQDGPFAIVGEVSSPVIHSYTDASTLHSDTTYWYRVTADNRRGESNPSVASAVVAVVDTGRGQATGNP